MNLRKLIKHNARRALRGHWPCAVAIVLLMLVIVLAFAVVEQLLNVLLDISPYLDLPQTPDVALDDIPNHLPLSLAVITGVGCLTLLVTVPLWLGIQGWFYRLGDGHVGEITDIFAFLGSLQLFARSLLLRLSVVLRCLLRFLLVLPAVWLGWFSWTAMARARSDSEVLLAQGGVVVSVLLSMALLLLACIWCMRYAVAPYAFVDAPEQGVSAAIRRSVQATRGRCVELLVLELSLLGWNLMGYLFLFPLLYTGPYVSTVKGLYAHYLLVLAEHA